MGRKRKRGYTKWRKYLGKPLVKWVKEKLREGYNTEDMVVELAEILKEKGVTYEEIKEIMPRAVNSVRRRVWEEKKNPSYNNSEAERVVEAPVEYTIFPGTAGDWCGMEPITICVPRGKKVRIIIEEVEE